MNLLYRCMASILLTGVTLLQAIATDPMPQDKNDDNSSQMKVTINNPEQLRSNPEVMLANLRSLQAAFAVAKEKGDTEDLKFISIHIFQVCEKLKATLSSKLTLSSNVRMEIAEAIRDSENRKEGKLPEGLRFNK